MATNKYIRHFRRLGKAITESHVPDPLIKDPLKVLLRTAALDPRCGMGTEDPRGGDLLSHLAYLDYREAWVRKQGHCDKTE